MSDISRKPKFKLRHHAQRVIEGGGNLSKRPDLRDIQARPILEPHVFQKSPESLAGSLVSKVRQSCGLNH